MKVLKAITISTLLLFSVLPFAFGGEHHTLRFHYPNSPSVKRACSLAISQDGKEVALCVEPGTVHFVRTSDGNQIAEIEARPLAMKYSRDGSRLLMMETYKSFSVNTKTRQAIAVNTDEVLGFTGLRIAARNGKLLLEEIHKGSSVAESGRFVIGDEVVAVGEGKAGPMSDLIGLARPDALRRIKGPVNTFVRVQVLHKGQRQSETVLLKRQAFTKTDGVPLFLPFTVPPITDNLVLVQRDGRHTFLSALDGKPIGSIIAEDLEQVGQHAISPDQRRFATLAFTREDHRKYGIEVFDLTKLERTLSLPFERDSFSALAFSADGKELFAGTWQWIDVFEVSTGKFLRSYRLDGGITTTFEERPKKEVRSILESPGQQVQSIALSPMLMAVSSALGQVELWDLATGILVKVFPFAGREQIYRNRLVEFLEFSPDGRWLVFYVNGVLNIVDVAEFQIEATTAGDAER